MKNALWIIVAIVIVGGGIYWWTTSESGVNNTNVTVNQGAESPAPGAVMPTDDTPDTGASSPAATAVTVTYDGTAFTPKDVTIQKGGTVTWKNSSTGDMWVASAQHPTHTVYSGTSRSEHCAASYTGPTPFDQCKGSDDYTFIFDKLGKNGYHNHINASAFGSVTVVE